MSRSDYDFFLPDDEYWVGVNDVGIMIAASIQRGARGREFCEDGGYKSHRIRAPKGFRVLMQPISEVEILE